MSAVDIALGGWAQLQAQAAPIRVAVFVEEQRVPVEMEWDEFDAVSLHAVARLGGRVVGTARLLPDGHIGRMAVLADSRGQGVGGALLDAMIEAGQAAGHRELLLHAQCHAQAFYARAGFVPRGAVFEEAGIAHVLMVRASPQAAA